MNKSYQADAAVAKLLACLPAFGAWSDAPLDPNLHRLLRKADQQTIMTVAVYALRRIAQDTSINTHARSKWLDGMIGAGGRGQAHS